MGSAEASAVDEGALIDGATPSWPLVRGSFGALGLAFAVLVGVFASSLESWLLTAELLIMGSAILLSPRIGRSLALHIVSGSFLVYQTIVLDVTRGTPNIGVVWFLLVPTWATLWGRARHLFLWVPATAVAVGWTALRADPADAMWQHPLSVPNLFAVLGLSAVLAVAFHRERRRREQALQRAMHRLQAETRDRKAAEAQARTDRVARHRLLAMLSHELRSPMTSLALTADMLDVDSGGGGQSLGQLQRTARATLRTLDDILDLVRLEDGVLPQRREEFSVSKLLDDVVEVVSPQMDGSRIRLVVDVESETPDRWSGDRARLRQVLLNLLGNALKHTREGQVRVAVGRAAEQGGLSFAVEDTGVGIAPTVIRDVFEPWQQGEQASVGGGVGLGLSISRDFVEAMGGAIWVDETSPQGTRLCFRVSMDALAGPTVAWDAKARESRSEPSKPALPRRGELRGRRVLVVDDDATVREVVARVLEHVGARVETAADGREAEERLRSEAFDLVVLDLEMPGRTGVDVLASMSSVDAPPVLVLSGSLDAEAAALDAGADAFVVKPVRTGELLEVAVRLSRGAGRPESASL
ncbi:MAG: hybrid sensor histidine kinase/response regulator [Nannocystales bacterium]